MYETHLVLLMVFVIFVCKVVGMAAGGNAVGMAAAGWGRWARPGLPRLLGRPVVRTVAPWARLLPALPQPPILHLHLRLTHPPNPVLFARACPLGVPRCGPRLD